MAEKLFGTTDNILGKVLEFQHEDLYQVTGIFEGTPVNSTDQFDFVLSFELFKDLVGPGQRDWGNTAASTFVILKKGTDREEFNAKIAGFIKSKDETSNTDVFARPYSDRHLYNNYENGQQAGGRIEYVRLFSLVAVFILVIACINFMNLSTAKASRRLKEVGIKKTVGAGRKALIIQYLGESLLLAFISAAIATILVVILLPQFNEFSGKQLMLDFRTGLLLPVLGITAITGLLAGSYPALYLSGFSPVNVLKGKLRNSPGEEWARKGLVVFQFAISIILIVSVMVVYKQIEYVQSKNLGYNKDNVIYFEREGRAADDLEIFLSEIKNIPGIVDASSTAHHFTMAVNKTSGVQWEGKDPDNNFSFEIVKANYGLIETLDIEMAQGRAFSRNFSNDSSTIIFNQAAIKAMGFQDPIGKTVRLFGDNRQIIGVTKDFHFQSLHEAVKPLFFILTPPETNKVMIKIAGSQQKEVIDKLLEFYQSFNPGFSLDYKFLDQEYQAQYVAEKRVSILSQYFAGLAILISCLGLFGLASFTSEKRLKEIGIRKILGSSEFAIVRLLSSDFTKMVLIAIVIAIPISYLITLNWLNDFAYRIDLAWWFFVAAGLIALLIAWLTVSLHTFKASRINPVECLRNE